MAYRIDNFPSWMRTGLNPCPECGKPVLLFYDEDQQYSVKCCECHFRWVFRTDSMEQAKKIWNGNVPKRGKRKVRKN